jgi:hypothetical protein
MPVLHPLQPNRGEPNPANISETSVHILLWVSRNDKAVQCVKALLTTAARWIKNFTLRKPFWNEIVTFNQMRHEFAPRRDGHISSCREAGPTGNAGRDRRSFTPSASGCRHRRSFSAFLGYSNLDRCGVARGAVARHSPAHAGRAGSARVAGTIESIGRLFGQQEEEQDSGCQKHDNASRRVPGQREPAAYR